MTFRIFISSVQDEFAEERRRLKQWLTTDLFVQKCTINAQNAQPDFKVAKTGGDSTGLLGNASEKTQMQFRGGINVGANDPINDPINLLDLIKDNPSLKYGEYGKMLGVSEATIKRRMAELKNQGKIVRIGANKGGHWEVVK